MVFSRLDIINAALLATGCMPLDAEGDGSLEWELLSGNWQQIVEAELEDGQYAYSVIEEEVATREGDGRFNFDDRYATPASALHVRAIWTETTAGKRTYLNEWEQDGTSISCNAASGIWVEYVEVIGVDEFPALFAQGIQFKLEALIYRAVREEATMAREREQWAEEKLQRARTRSSKMKGPKPMFRRPGQIRRSRFSRG